MYVKQPLIDAVEEVLNILGRPSSEWKEEYRSSLSENERAHQYEVDETIYTLRAALGRPVPRQKCSVCGARDSIYWERDPVDPEIAPKDNPGEAMWCHQCGAIDPPHETITEVVE